MAGRPYRGEDGTFESADLSPPALSDDAALFALLLNHPDFLDEDVLFMADGRVLAESDPAWRTVLGWHRGSGPVLLGVTTGGAGESLLIEVLQLAESSADWPLARWDEALAAFWGSSDGALRQRVAERWGLKGEVWTVEGWAQAVWDGPPTKGRAAVGILAAEVPVAIRRAVAWLAAGGREIAAFEVQRMVAGSAPIYWTNLVAGAWHRRVTPVAASADAGLRRETYVRHTGSVTAGLLSAVEARGLQVGSKVAWSGQDWVRFDGAGRSLRVFPGAGWIDLQFVDADEGTLTGLRYRYGVAVALEPPPDAPPGVHLRLSSAGDMNPAVELLLTAWLGEVPAQDVRETSAARPRRSKRAK
jgi:hypothetical protein